MPLYSLKSSTDENNSSNVGGPGKMATGTPESGGDQTPKAEELCKAAFDKYEEAKNYRKNWDKDWDRYMRYWAGQQNAGKLAWRTDATYNLILPVIESIVSHMTDSNPTITISPCEPDFIDSADVMQQVLLRTWTDNKMEDKLPLIVRDTLIYGTSYAKVWYDKRQKLVTIDEIDVRKVFVSPGAVDFTDALWCVYRDNVPKAAVESKFPGCKGKLEGGLWDPEATFLKNVTTTKKDGDIPGVSLIPGQFPGVASKTGGKSNNVDKDLVTYIEYWHRGDGPEGWNEIWCTTAANGFLLSHKMQEPKGLGRFPFVKFINYGQTNTFYGMGEIQNLEKPQDSINMRNGQAIDLLRLVANPPFLRPHNSGISNTTIPNIPGIMLSYNHPYKPEWLQPAHFPQELYGQIENDKKMMEEIPGISDASQGRKPKGITSAQGIVATAEIGQTRIRPKIRSMESSLRTVCEIVLAYVQCFYTEQRIIRVAGRRKSAKLGQFVKVNTPALDENNQPVLKNDLSIGKYDVDFSTGSLPDFDKAAKYEQMKELAQLLGPGIIPPKIILQAVPDLTQEEVDMIMMEAQAAAPMPPGMEGAPEQEGGAVAEGEEHTPPPLPPPPPRAVPGGKPKSQRVSELQATSFPPGFAGKLEKLENNM